MKRERRHGWKMVAGLFGVTLLGCVGCQTNMGGMTLPSAYYLQQRPTYVTPSPQFPLPRELAQQQAAASAAGVDLMTGRSVNSAMPR